MILTSRFSHLTVALGLAFASAAHLPAGQSAPATPANPSSAMSDAPSGYSYKILSPAGRDFLKCRFLCPDDFRLADLPADEPDFTQSKNFMPLGVAVANYGAVVVFSVAARPAYKEGTVAEWLAHLCKEEGYDPGAVELIKVGALDAAACDAIKTADGVTMRMRITLLEDGGRLYNFSAMAPTQLWSAVADKLNGMLASFELQEDKGPTMALSPEAAAPAVATAAPSENSARLTPEQFAELVLADDMSALDPEQKINANLRDNAVGFVPNVLSVNKEEKSARVGAGAIEAIFRVPFGWHVNDDGRRTLVFDGGGRMQINLSLRRREIDSLVELARSYVAPYLEQQPGLEAFVHELDGIVAIGVRGLKVDDEVLDQTFLLRDIDRDGLVLVARATGSSDDIRLAMNLAGDILAGIETAATMAAAR
jgi:hypothetical protein